MNAIAAVASEPVFLPFGSFEWFQRELAPTPLRKIRTAIMVGGAVLCVIISMALQVPELALTGFIVFFVSKETKVLTTLTGVIGTIGSTIGIGVSLVLYKFTYGYLELRIPGMAIALFFGMYLSRVFVVGPLGFLIGFNVAYSQSLGEAVPSPEQLVRDLLWLWVAVAYGAAVGVVLNFLFLPDEAKPAAPKLKSELATASRRPHGHRFFVPDAFTNPAHVHFALKVTFAAMVCYIFYSAIDWSGIHTALITCTFIALGSTGATFHRGILRIGGCVVGGALALFTIIFLMPHMVTIASLVVVVACASAIAGWVASGSEMISYAGIQMAFAFFYSLFQGYAPDTDLDNVRDRVIGILLGLVVTGVIFQYIWPERAIDQFRDALRQALRQLAHLLEVPAPKTSTEQAKSETRALIAETAKTFDQARHDAELTRFEFEDSLGRDRNSFANLQTALSRADDVFVTASSLASKQAWDEWQQLPGDARLAESELRSVAAKRLERAADGDAVKALDDTDVSTAFAIWKDTVQRVSLKNGRAALVSRIVAEVQHLDRLR